MHITGITKSITLEVTSSPSTTRTSVEGRIGRSFPRPTLPLVHVSLSALQTHLSTPSRESHNRKLDRLYKLYTSPPPPPQNLGASSLDHARSLLTFLPRQPTRPNDLQTRPRLIRLLSSQPLRPRHQHTTSQTLLRNLLQQSVLALEILLRSVIV